MPEVTYSLEVVVSDLDAKIKELEKLQGQIEEALKANVSPGTNVVALEQVTSSLEAAQVGRLALLKGCCTVQNCKVVYDPAPGVGRAV